MATKNATNKIEKLILVAGIYDKGYDYHKPLAKRKYEIETMQRITFKDEEKLKILALRAFANLDNRDAKAFLATLRKFDFDIIVIDLQNDRRQQAYRYLRDFAKQLVIVDSDNFKAFFEAIKKGNGHGK